MKKTTIINYGVGALIALTGLTSCGGVYTGMGYDDGIYGDKAPRPSYERDDYERAPRTYREQLNQKMSIRTLNIRHSVYLLPTLL